MPALPQRRLLVSAVVLAAGRSERMQGRNKLTLEIAGEPMLRRTVWAVLGIEPVECVVVTGHDARDIGGIVSDLPVRAAHNTDHARGQPFSVAAGVRALSGHCDAIMVVPADQPLLTSAHLAALVTAYGSIGDRSILMPMHEGYRGNPILFAAHHAPAITAGDLGIGCRRLIQSHPDLVARIEFDSDAYVLDCDTPEEFAALQARLETVSCAA